MAVPEPLQPLHPPRVGRRRVNALLDLGRCLSAPKSGLSPDLRTDWGAVVATAEYFRLTPALWDAVGDRAEIEPALSQRLRAEYAANVVTNGRLLRQLRTCLRACNEAGLAPVVLKGAHELLKSPDTLPPRMMTDIDLLVGEDEWDRALDVLQHLGYGVYPGTGLSAGHEWTARHPEHAAPVDVHRALGSTAVARAMPTTEVLSRALDRVDGDLRYRVLEPADQLAHAVVHSQCSDRAHRTASVPLRQLHNFASLYRQLDDPESWRTAVGRLTECGLGRVVGGHAALERRIFALALAQPEPDTASRAHLARCLATYAVPGVSDTHTNLVLTFEAPTMAQRYPGTPLAVARLRHAALLSRGGMRSLHSALVTRNR
jgi:Uncharacterised nucleotidyltransferase